jgi:hypothetical protein
MVASVVLSGQVCVLRESFHAVGFMFVFQESGFDRREDVFICNS